MKKAVFFDIDGTLWDEQMRIPESTVEAVRALRENGNYAFLCTGRSRSNIRSETLLGIGFDGIVAACGTHIDFHEGKEFELLLTKEQTEHALAVLKAHHMPVVLEGPEYTYVDEMDFADDPYVVHLREELGESLKSISGSTEFEINKMSAAVKGADINDVIKALEEDFDIIIHHEGLVEIVPKGHSKATGIEKVCQILQIAKEDTYAFGDSANDLTMLDFVAHGIAMGNGTDAAKQAAEFVTTDINQDGIKNGLLHYGLI